VAKEIHSGDLKHRVVLKQPTEAVNNEGGTELSYPTSTIETWAAIKTGRQYRTNEASGTGIITVDEFFIRWAAARGSIAKDWLLVFNSKDYTIHEVDTSSKKFIRIVARVKD